MTEIDKEKVFTQQMVDMIFSFGELGFQETETSRYITDILKKNGFLAEELLGTKAYYVRDGYFKHIDACIFTHMASNLGVSYVTMEGME